MILAAALAQSPDALLLDEPTTFLDIRHQVTLYRILRGLCDRGILVIAVTHDLNLAAAYAHRVIVLQAGRVAGTARPEEPCGPTGCARFSRCPPNCSKRPGGRHWIRYGD